ncbi:MAG: S41 family peptidase [Salibacteraceae bacterium]
MKTNAYIPILLALAMAIGLLLGSKLNSREQIGSDARWDKVEQMLQYVSTEYVDTISKKQLEDEVIALLLQRLDPHSHYISSQELESINEPLEGNFEGIGVQFNLRQDSIYVVSVIEGGPSSDVGLRAGDLIVAVDDEIVAGTQLTNRRVMKLLKGPSGSEVKVGVKRGESDGLLTFQIIRGEIPIQSIDAAYLINDSTIYVRLARFSLNTYQEFVDRVYPLKTTEVNSMVLDLRRNGGGYLNAAVSIADEFLTDGALITYTEGKSRPRMEFRATDEGRFDDVAMAVIIDGFSASASEIIAGAMQDLNRATIVGSRSFGKGLVQEQNEWLDGSATRLTVARYYTPNGRSIQRPYDRFSLSSVPEQARDSIQGGIEPDIDVERDTAGITWLYAEAVHRGLVNAFSYAYRDQQFANFSAMSEVDFMEKVSTDSIAQALHVYLNQELGELNEQEWKRSEERMALRSKAIIGRSLFGEESYFKIYNPTDPFVNEALRHTKKPAWNEAL